MNIKKVAYLSILALAVNVLSPAILIAQEIDNVETRSMYDRFKERFKEFLAARVDNGKRMQAVTDHNTRLLYRYAQGQELTDQERAHAQKLMRRLKITTTAIIALIAGKVLYDFVRFPSAKKKSKTNYKNEIKENKIINEELKNNVDLLPLVKSGNYLRIKNGHDIIFTKGKYRDARFKVSLLYKPRDTQKRNIIVEYQVDQNDNQDAIAKEITNAIQPIATGYELLLVVQDGF